MEPNTDLYASGKRNRLGGFVCHTCMYQATKDERAHVLPIPSPQI